MFQVTDATQLNDADVAHLRLGEMMGKLRDVGFHVVFHDFFQIYP